MSFVFYAQWVLVLRGKRIRLIHENNLQSSDIEIRWTFTKDSSEIFKSLRDAYLEILEDEDEFDEDTDKIKDAIQRQFPEVTI